MRGLGFGYLIVAATTTTIPHVAVAQLNARFNVPRDTALTDEKLRIVLTGARPSSYVTIRLAGMGQTSRATFISDRAGTVDLSRTAPVAGSYATADAMGLFWSLRREGPPPPGGAASPRASTVPPGALPFQLIAESSGAILATDTVWRRPVAANVRVTRVRDAGFTGILYEPPGAERRAAVVVLPGSNGGTPPANSWPGGLSSRGYVVLSLAYFGDEDVPEQLSNIPLEYFEGALNWLRKRPNVDSARVGVLGESAGGVLVLLLGATYPRLIKTVVALVPGSVVWPGCCDSTSRISPSWTLNGKALPHMPPEARLESELTELSRNGTVYQSALFEYKLRDSAAATRAAIPVEKIRGPVLLVSARDDLLYPSYQMSEQVMARLRKNKFPYPYKHVSYEGAGHALRRPYVTAANTETVHPVTGRRTDSGGNPPMMARAREEAWAEILTFLDTHLRGQKPSK